MSKKKSSAQKPTNPFLDDFVKQEIKFYGLTNYDKSGIVVRSIKLSGRCDDLLNVNFRVNKFKCPQFFIDGGLWMTMTHMEIQSQYLPIKKAKGKVGIGGLGMGYCLLRMMEKDNVTSVDVYEIDQRVVDFFTENFSDRKGFEKVTFIVGDAREKLQKKIYDFVYIDIYADMLPDEVLTDKELFCNNNQIKTYHFWAQEKVFKCAYELGIIQLYQCPPEILELLSLWMVSDGAKLRDKCLGEDFITDALATFELL